MDDNAPNLRRPSLALRDIVSDHIFSEEFQDIFSKHWCSQISLKIPNLEIITEPFRVCRISNFLKSEQFLDDLKCELSDVQSRRHVKDMYHNEQTDDLYNFGGDTIQVLHKAFRNEMVTWLEHNTNIELNSGISMSSACYYDTDYLLCHDDNATDRKIAFVLYLVPDWSPEEGGSLDLFDTDEQGFPNKVVRSLYPEYNSLVFFEVSEHSFHQVAEVITPDMPRWSINGWFHGPRKRPRPPNPEFEPQYFQPIHRDENLHDWVNDTYLCKGIVKSINQEMESQSYTSLAQFIKEDVYSKLSKEITADSIKWKRAGPANLRNYEIADATSLTGIWKSFYEALQTVPFLDLLQKYTELDILSHDKTNSKPKMTIELQRWSRGCYTIINDKNIVSDHRMAEECHADDESSETNSPIKQEMKLLQTSKIGTDDDSDSEDEKIIEISKSRCFRGNKNDKTIDNSSDSELEPPRVKKPRYEKKTKQNEKKEDIEKSTGQIGLISNKNENLGGLDLTLPKLKKQKQEKKFDFSENKEEASCSKSDDYTRSPPLHPDSEDSQVSDIGDYLSGSSRFSDDDDERNEDPGDGPGTLDLVIQFNTSNFVEEDIIHWVDPTIPDGEQAHIASQDNRLTLVYYKDAVTCRVHKYINHYIEGYFYNLLCTYHERDEQSEIV